MGKQSSYASTDVQSKSCAKLCVVDARSARQRPIELKRPRHFSLSTLWQVPQPGQKAEEPHGPTSSQHKVTSKLGHQLPRKGAVRKIARIRRQTSSMSFF